jgi:acetyl esterase/lipase
VCVIAIVDQVYSEIGGQALRYDLFRPDNGDSLPLIVCLHGGGWISGSKEDYRDVALAMCRAGFAAAVPSYRLAPLHPFPAAVEDVAAFIRSCRESAGDWNVNPDRIGAIGNSAGGHLASMAGLHPDIEARANAVVDICGISDLRKPREIHLPISWGFVDQFLPWEYEGNESKFEQASPICQISPGAPPFLVIHGEDDDVVPVSQSDAFVGALKEAGVSVEYHRYPHEAHSFTLSAWNAIEATSTRFFRDRLIGVDDTDAVMVDEDGLRV